MKHIVKRTYEINCGDVRCGNCYYMKPMQRGNKLYPYCLVFHEYGIGTRLLPNRVAECLELDKPEAGSWKWALMNLQQGFSVAHTTDRREVWLSTDQHQLPCYRETDELIEVIKPPYQDGWTLMI